MAKWNFENTEDIPNPDMNDKFKSRKVAGIPKMNYYVFVLPRLSSGLSDTDFNNWRYVGGFKECDGLSINIEQQDYSDTDTKNVVIKNPGKISFNNISLARGYDKDHFCKQWHNQKGSPAGQSDNYMADVVILKMTHNTTKIARSILIRNGWVSVYTPESMDDTTTDPWLERLELSHDGWAFGYLDTAVFDETDVISPGGDEFTETLGYAKNFTYDFYWNGSAYEPINLNFFINDDAQKLAE